MQTRTDNIAELLIGRYKILAIPLFFIFLFTACAPKHKLVYHTKAEKNLDKNSSFKSPGSDSYTTILNKKKNGIFIDDNAIYIKTNGKSILSIVDELAFKKRYSYTVLTKLPAKRLKIFNAQDKDLEWSKRTAKKFNNIKEALLFLENFMNWQCGQNSTGCNYKITYDSDGIVLSGSNRDYVNSYKKQFFYNIGAQEANRHIKEFFSKNKQISFTSIVLPAQNALIIKADKKVLANIGQIMHAVDANAPQVMIESKVFEYDDTIGRKIGMAIDYSKTNGDFIMALKTFFDTSITDTTANLSGNLNDVEKKESILTTLALQDRNGDVKILAEPRVVLKPGKEAVIKLTTNKYVPISGVNTSKLEKIETGIIFVILPTILSDSTIQLKLQLKQSEFIPINEEKIVQSVNSNEVSTTVIAKDGELISIGGIYLEKKSQYNSGIPFLADLPVLKYIFGSTSTDSRRVMVDFLIRPTIKRLSEKQNLKKQKVLNLYYKK